MDLKVKELADLPYTISFIIRKRQQIDGFNELPKEKRPVEKLIWDSDPEEMEEWLDTVLDSKKKNQQEVTFQIKDSEIEK